jgi:hypothetical protein
MHDAECRFEPTPKTIDVAKGVTYFDAVSSVIATIRTVSGFSR